MGNRPLIPDSVFEQCFIVEYKPDPNNNLTTVHDNGPDPEFMAALKRGDHLRWLLEQQGITDPEEQDRQIARIKAISDRVRCCE